MTKRVLLLLFVMLPIAVGAQWKLGGYLGGTYNTNYFFKHYLTSFHYGNGYFGMTFGLVGQYDLKQWNWFNSRLGIRAELSLVEKNYQTAREPNIPSIYLAEKNGYVQMPVMATYSCGWKIFRPFVNLGFFGAYFASGKKEWQNGFDAGGIGGIGGELNFGQLTLQAEARAYAGAISITKSQGSRFKAPYYNTTAAIIVSLLYNI